tara:strand:+ start:575 stop:808 length:234 start_codon:yes stop_codon:yes gene_type:complete
LATKPFGIDIDPENNLTHEPQPDGDVKTTYKGKNIDYMDYIDELEERTTLKSQGKSLKSSMGLFAGFGKGTLNKGNK